tara:strand:+ start:397 stop:645 length:249 start_codon:yes stop_codon:yes gene_type:complete
MFYNIDNISLISNDERFIMIRFEDAREVLNILRDVQSYIFIQSRNDKLAELILTRISRVLEANDNTKQSGETNEENKRNQES